MVYKRSDTVYKGSKTVYKGFSGICKGLTEIGSRIGYKWRNITLKRANTHL